MKLYENALSETKLTDQRRLSFTGARVFEALAEAGDAARRSTHEQVVRRKEGRRKTAQSGTCETDWEEGGGGADGRTHGRIVCVLQLRVASEWGENSEKVEMGSPFHSPHVIFP